MSLALLILYAEFMTVMRVIHLDLAGSRYRETLGRSFVCLDFSHNFCSPFTDALVVILYRYCIIKALSR